MGLPQQFLFTYAQETEGTNSYQDNELFQAGPCPYHKIFQTCIIAITFPFRRNPVRQSLFHIQQPVKPQVNILSLNDCLETRGIYTWQTNSSPGNFCLVDINFCIIKAPVIIEHRNHKF
ncbi:hypothetical protein D3C78_1502540 [compost metagenome]